MGNRESPDAQPGDELVAQLAFVQRLSRALARDESAADDLAQDTLVQALHSPARAGFTPRAWLRAITRRLAWRARRSESRRLVHEQALPTPGSQSSAFETAAIFELTRIVVAELHQLAEPYATTLRERFFDGLDASAIAARDGLPVETVRTRVKRGVAQLRERLDARHGGSREAWAMVLVGGAVMTAKAKLLVAAVVVAALGGGWWVLKSSGTSRSHEVAHAGGDRPLAARAPEPANEPSVEVARETLPSPAALSSPSADGVLLHGRITDSAGAGIGDVWLTMDAEVPLADAKQIKVDADGSFAFAGLTPGIWRLRIRECEGFEPVELRVRLAVAPAVQRFDVVLTPSRMVAVRIVTPDGKRLADALGEDEGFRAFRGLGLVASPSHLPRLLVPDTSAKNGLSRTCFVSGSRRSTVGYLGMEAKRLEIPEDVDALFPVSSFPTRVGAYFKHVLLQDVLVEESGDVAQIVIAPEEIEDCLATVTVRFVDAVTKQPLKHGHVECTDRQTSGGNAQPQADGSLRFEGLPPGLMHFARWPDAYEMFETFVVIEPGAELDLGEIALSKYVEAKVRLVDERGRPVRGYVQAFALDRLLPELPIDSQTGFRADADGWVEQLRIGAGRWLLHSRHSENGAQLSSDAVVLDASSGAPPPLEIVLHPTTRGRIDLPDASAGLVTIRVTDAAGLPVDGWQFPAPASWIHALPRGDYRFDARASDGRVAIRTVTVGEAPFLLELTFGTTPEPLPILDARPSVDDATATRSGADPANSSREILLHGSLRDAAGRPLQAKQAHVVDADGRTRAGGSSSGGSYVVPGLAPGICDLKITADGFAEWHESVNLAAGAEAVRHDVVLQPLLQIPVRFVTPQGESLWKAVASSRRSPATSVSGPPLTIVATKEPLAAGMPGWSVRRETTYGRFQCQGGFTGVFDGTLELRGELPLVANILLERRVLESRPIPSPVDELVFVVDPSVLASAKATVRWRIADARSGSPFDLTEVFIGGKFGESSPEARQFLQPDGSYEITGLDPGELSLLFFAADHEQMRNRLLIAPGEVCDLGTIQLAPSATIAGRVVGPDGAPARARISAVVFDRLLPAPFIGREKYSSSGEVRGEFTIGVGRRRVLLFVTADGCAWESRVVDASAGDVRDLEFRLVPGTRVAVHVAADRWRWLTVEVRDEAGEPIGSQFTLGNDTARFALRPGTYRVVVLEESTERVVRDLVVGETAVVLEIQLP